VTSFEQESWRTGRQCSVAGDDDPCRTNRPAGGQARDPAPAGGALENLEGLVEELAGDEFASASAQDEEFSPRAPESLEEAQLDDHEVEALVLKYLFHQSSATGRQVSEQVGLPFALMHGFLQHLKVDRLVVHKDATRLNDYVYELTELGRDRKRTYTEQSTYYGAAPVSLRDYIGAVKAQSVLKQRPTITDVCQAFSDLDLSIEMISMVGQAIHVGSALFLYGAPGNGKTSMAERIIRAFGEPLWIPRAIGISGEVVRLFDPSNHKELPLPANQGLVNERPIDERWVRIRRPTLMVGGELTMDNLEITNNRLTGVSEAPLQLKANGGTLVIDDFGRQRMSTRELLNRWILPLENGYDFLELASGRRFQVPFDQMIVFSTNLEPIDLVDEAFLRRIPYKIHVTDPTEAQFKTLFAQTAAAMGMTCPEDAIEYLVATHYRAEHRRMRFCHPRDLLRQIHTFCSFTAHPLTVTRKGIDSAVKTYFGAM